MRFALSQFNGIRHCTDVHCERVHWDALRDLTWRFVNSQNCSINFQQITIALSALGERVGEPS